MITEKSDFLPHLIKIVPLSPFRPRSHTPHPFSLLSLSFHPALHPSIAGDVGRYFPQVTGDSHPSSHSYWQAHTEAVSAAHCSLEHKGTPEFAVVWNGPPFLTRVSLSSIFSIYLGCHHDGQESCWTENDGYLRASFFARHGGAAAKDWRALPVWDRAEWNLCLHSTIKAVWRTESPFLYFFLSMIPASLL